jgi:cytidine kinase
LVIDDIVVWNKGQYLNSIGGSSLYSSGGASIWGDSFGIVGCVGEDYDFEMLRKMTSSVQADLRGIKKKTGRRRRVWVLFDENDDHYFVPKHYSASAQEVTPKPGDIPKEYLDQAKVFHIAPFPVNAQCDIVNYLHANNKIITLDPDYDFCTFYWDHEWKNILNKIDVFLPSQIEFDRMINCQNSVMKLTEYENKLREFSECYGIKYVILKLGKSGVILYDGLKKKSTHFPSVKVNVVDCTGAGDSFAGGFCHSYKYDHDPYKATLYGLVSSAITIESLGAEGIFKYSQHVALEMLSNYKC